MRLTYVLGLLAVCAFAANASAGIIYQDNVASNAGWSNEVPTNQYSSLGTSGDSHTGLSWSGGKSMKHKFSATSQAGYKQAGWREITVDPAQGLTFTVTGYMCPRDANIVNGLAGINIVAGPHVAGSGWPGAPGIDTVTLTAPTGNPAGWRSFTDTITAPAGTTKITLFLSVQHAPAPAGATAELLYDDIQIEQTPEPATLGLLALGAPLLLRRRR
jgi:MYXO-CTERM domain-containing protein